MERLTIKDIAKMAGVSHTTVSRALNGAQNIRPETYAKIMELCRTTGYTPNAAARQLKRSDSGAIGIIVPDISNAFSATHPPSGMDGPGRKDAMSLFLVLL